MSEPRVSVDQVSEHLGIAKDTIYRWIETRDFPIHRFHRLWTFELSELHAWVYRGEAGNDHDVKLPKKEPR